MSENNGVLEKISNEWTHKLLIFVSGLFVSLAGTYGTQYIAFLKDAPTRKEVSETVEKAMQNTPYTKDRDLLQSVLKNIESQQRENHVALIETQKTLHQLATSVALLEQRLPKKESRP